LTALHSSHPSAVLEPRAKAVQKAADVDAIIVYGLDGITIAHSSDPARIGQQVVGPYAEAAAGPAFTRTFKGPLGRSVISVVPVKDTDGSVVAIIAAPVTIENVQHAVNRQLPVVFGSAAVALALAAGGAGLVSRRLRRQTHGLDPSEMTRMYE